MEGADCRLERASLTGLVCWMQVCLKSRESVSLNPLDKDTADPWKYLLCLSSHSEEKAVLMYSAAGMVTDTALNQKHRRKTP